MKTRNPLSRRIVFVTMAAVVLGLLAPGGIWPNGGPFVVKYPGGDPAAKGVLARIDPDLKPARETRLEVVKEDLSIVFDRDRWAPPAGERPPLVNVKAEYHIRNPTDDEVTVDFGFPILRGIYMDPRAMIPRPAVGVTVDGKHVRAAILSNSFIYGTIRRHAHETIEAAVQADPRLAPLFARVRNSRGADRDQARTALAAFLQETLDWNDRDAALLAEYAGLDLGKKGMPLVGVPFYSLGEPELAKVAMENLGVLAAIGEQKATQLLAHLAGRLDSHSASGYERIFKAWGGDVRERSIDLETGEVRPRENSLASTTSARSLPGSVLDPTTVYARVDYLHDDSTLAASERTSLKNILKNLPVIFTFAPMNLLHYQVTFRPRGEQTVTVAYQQYAYMDSRQPKSYQLAYVVHPASLWERFGPIHLTIRAPEGVNVVSSVPAPRAKAPSPPRPERRPALVAYTATLKEKTGELFVAIDSESWKRALATPSSTPVHESSSR